MATRGRKQPLPLVLLPHDGPWARDSYGFNAMHQWLANRGYAVLSVNFRGSTGLRQSVPQCRQRRMGRRACRTICSMPRNGRSSNASRSPIASPSWARGFGGYAALSGLAFTPDQFRCGASFAAPANLFAMLDVVAGARSATQLYQRVADARTEAGPLSCCASARRCFTPRAFAGRCLLAHGLRDPRSDARRDRSDRASRASRGALTYLAVSR